MSIVRRILLIAFVFISLPAIIIIIAGGGFGSKLEEGRLSFPGNQSVLLFAHRGSGIYYPENSLEGMEAALASGFKAIETDIRLTADDSLVIFHDENCLRLIGKNVPVDELTSAEIKNSFILFNGLPSSSRVIMLEDLFKEVGGKAVMYLDVKLHSIEIAKKISSLISKYHSESTTLVANSNLLFISWLEFTHPEIITVLEGFTPGKEWLYTGMPKKFRPDYFASFAQENTEEHIDWLRSKNLLEHKIVYGVDSKNFLPTINSGIQKIILDYDSTLTDAVNKFRN